MIRNTQTIIFVALLWLAFVPACKAQWVCSIPVPANAGIPQPGDTMIEHYSLAYGADGNYCTVAMLENKGLYNSFSSVHLYFFRSTNGGKSWEEQDPGIPILYDNYHFLRALDQIDSNTAIAVGDSALILRTDDGGQTWRKLPIPVYAHLFCVSFANRSEGMVLGEDDTLGLVTDYLLTTTNGGNQWKNVPFGNYATTGKSYGNGKFRLFQYGYGSIYNTDNYFQVIDSTKPILDSLKVINGHDQIFGGCAFGAGDTMIAYGGDRVDNVLFNSQALIWRSTDAGATWAKILDTDNNTGGITNITDLDRDTVIAGLLSEPHLLLSTDHGVTWKWDTTIFDSASVQYDVCRWISLNPDGSIVGVFGPLTSCIVYGARTTAGVLSARPPQQIAQIYPNPATNSVTISSSLGGDAVHLYDILGRDVYSETIPASGSLKLDVSQLPRGFYTVTIDVDHARLSAGRIILVAD